MDAPAHCSVFILTISLLYVHLWLLSLGELLGIVRAFWEGMTSACTTSC
jgi:hypothetical protein